MASLEFLKPVLGDQVYTSFLEKMNDAPGITLVNASDGSYVPKAKFDTEIAAKKQYLSQVESLSKEKATLDAVISSLKNQLNEATETGSKREKDMKKDAEMIAKLQGEVKQLSGDLEQRTKDLEAAGNYKGEIERLNGIIAERDRSIDTIRKQGRLSIMLKESGARNPDVLMRMIDIDKVQEKDGKVTGLDEQLKALKASDPYLFTDIPAPRGGVDSVPQHPLSGEDALSRQVNLEIRRAAGYNV